MADGYKKGDVLHFVSLKGVCSHIYLTILKVRGDQEYDCYCSSSVFDGSNIGTITDLKYGLGPLEGNINKDKSLIYEYIKEVEVAASGD
jgi:hypothetical protein